MLKAYSFSIIAISMAIVAHCQVQNFSESGNQVTKFDELGNAVDAHDGIIALFNGTYYLYGTSYSCGFEWNNKTAPFCGFKVYTSKDLATWKEEGFLFDAKNAVWQKRCDGKTYGCFRPHVVYNKKNQQYVLWINVYDNVIGYRVFTSSSPTGPFKEVAEPKLIINNDKPPAGLNNGDHDLFVDDDGTAYLALTDWRQKGAIAIEQLTDDYLSGTGKVVTAVTVGTTEAPALFKRRGIYYITYSDPNCGYCAGTGTSYKTAPSVWGPWSPPKKISENSCGGQPSFVATIKLPGDTIYLYGSDLWNNAAKNEALANFYWMPLTFEADGSITPMECMTRFSLSPKKTTNGKKDMHAFKAICAINKNEQRGDSFTVARTGKLNRFSIPLLKSGYPESELIIDFYKTINNKKHLLTSCRVPADSIEWSARTVHIHPGFRVKRNESYEFVLRTNANKGCFGYAKQVSGTSQYKKPEIKSSWMVD